MRVLRVCVAPAIRPLRKAGTHRRISRTADSRLLASCSDGGDVLLGRSYRLRVYSGAWLGLPLAMWRVAWDAWDVAWGWGALHGAWGARIADGERADQVNGPDGRGLKRFDLTE